MNKSALVTGASSGIGYELARLLAKDGYRLFLVARDTPRLAEVARDLDATAVAVDLADPGGAARIAEALGDTAPGVLINNAGFGMGGGFTEIPLRTQLDMIQVNVTSLVELTHRLLPGMIARGTGRILNVASTAAFQPGPLMAIYYASKAFVLHFSEAIAEELRDTGVTVTALCPGPTKTEFADRANLKGTNLFKGASLKVMAADEVARIGYEAMMAGKTLKIAGLGNRLGMEGLRLAPRSLARKIVYKMQSR